VSSVGIPVGNPALSESEECEKEVIARVVGRGSNKKDNKSKNNMAEKHNAVAQQL
jgi:hypothetical protein